MPGSQLGKINPVRIKQVATDLDVPDDGDPNLRVGDLIIALNTAPTPPKLWVCYAPTATTLGWKYVALT
jgi:hypothetical protein